MRRQSKLSTPWWATEFGNQYLLTYQNKITQKQTNQEIAFITEAAHLEKSDNILDLGCGYGRHTIALAQKGFTVTGLDYSAPLIRAARREASKYRIHPVFVQGDMKKLPYKGAFNVVLSLFTSFGYFTHRENTVSLRKMYASLMENGRLFLDILNADNYRAEMKAHGTLVRPGVYTKTNEFRKGKLHFYNTNTFDENKGISHLRREWSDGSSSGLYNFHIRRYTRQELHDLLTEAGFTVERYWGDYSHGPWQPDSGRTIALAVKRQKRQSLIMRHLDPILKRVRRMHGGRRG